jgi:RNA polymerase sigma-70 factor (ECF subfamily)
MPVQWKSVTSGAAGRSEGFEELAMPLFPSLYNVACWLTRSHNDAEDLVQETFFKALRGFGGFERGTNFKAWIFRILRNTYLTSRAGLAVKNTVSLDENEEYVETAVDWDTPESRMLALSDQAEVRSAMEELPQSLLEVLLLCDVEEMKYKEIAMVLDLPIGTVMSRVSRARRGLREALLHGREERR